MRRRSLWSSTGGAVLAAVGMGTAQAGEPAGHRVVFHVGSADPAMMAVALHNIANAADFYADRKEAVAIELVANGPGYAMLRSGVSPVATEVAETKRKYPFVVFAACQNTRAGLAAAEHKAVQDIKQLPEATDVAAGVVRLTELQEQRYAYIRV